MKNPHTLEILSSRPKYPRLPMALRAAVAGLLLGSLPAHGSEPDRVNHPEYAMAMMKRQEVRVQPKIDAFGEGLKEIGQTKDSAQIRKIWLRLAVTDPSKTLQYSELIDSPFLMETLAMACGVSSDKYPDIFLDKALNCTDLPDYRHLVIKAAKNAADSVPEAAVRFKDRYETFPEGREIAKKAIVAMRKRAAGILPKIQGKNP
jgi:hypothetical protein